MEPLKEGDLPRFNMPFELGLDLGCREFGGTDFSNKKCLILEKGKHRYEQVISDLKGNDIRQHNPDPQQLVMSESGRVTKYGNGLTNSMLIF